MASKKSLATSLVVLMLAMAASRKGIALRPPIAVELVTKRGKD